MRPGARPPPLFHPLLPPASLLRPDDGVSPFGHTSSDGLSLELSCGRLGVEASVSGRGALRTGVYVGGDAIGVRGGENAQRTPYK